MLSTTPGLSHSEIMHMLSTRQVSRVAHSMKIGFDCSKISFLFATFKMNYDFSSDEHAVVEQFGLLLP